MGRIKFYFQGLENYMFDEDFDSKLSYLLFDKIRKFFYNSNFRNFKYYTFSKFNIENSLMYYDDVISKDGVVSVIISSANDTFLKRIVYKFLEGESLKLNDNELKLFKLEILKKPDFASGEMSFITLSPIFLHNYIVDGDLGNILKNILIKKYCRYFKVNDFDLSCDFYSKKNVYEHYTTYGEAGLYYDYYYHMDIIMVANPRLLQFAYDTGLGDSNHKGFGMLDLY